MQLYICLMTLGMLRGGAVCMQAYPYEGVTNFCKKTITDKVTFKKVGSTATSLSVLPPTHPLSLHMQSTSATCLPQAFLLWTLLMRCLSLRKPPL